jgi:hypothetical protein
MQRPWVEFVLGVGMTIKGFDRAIPKMSIGERSKIRVTPTYAYGESQWCLLLNYITGNYFLHGAVVPIGKEGLLPHIPPNSRLLFDCTLLSFRPRAMWVKPMIQVVVLPCALD